LQFYKRPSDAIARVGSNRTAGRIAVRSATACCLKCGVRRSIWVVCRQVRRSWRRPCSL